MVGEKKKVCSVLAYLQMRFYAAVILQLLTTDTLAEVNRFLSEFID